MVVSLSRISSSCWHGSTPTVPCRETTPASSRADIISCFQRQNHRPLYYQNNKNFSRHSAVTLLLAIGVDIKSIQELVGCHSIMTTLGIYGHVLLSMQEDIAD